jgi:phosphoribosylanthranilate isomerase
MTHVKICGITNVEDAGAAVEAGADLLGFIFYPPSPRFVARERAREIVGVIRLLAAGTRFVGVFVNAPAEQVADTMEVCGLDLAQFHGAEPPDLVRDFSPRCYKALRSLDVDSASALTKRYRESVNGNLPAFIVDAFNPNLFGGTGERADWVLAHGIALEFPILLAGGLVPENVAEAIARVQPWGVDVSSGVERSPGLKDHVKLRRFIEAARNEIGGLA